jgi:Fe-S oxidoreductase
LPAWRSDVHRSRASSGKGREVVLFVDCFSRYFEPENARAARAVLEAAGYNVVEPNSGRPLCCGRTFLSAGLVEPARAELFRVVATLSQHAQRGVPIIGIEPSCLLTFRDELKAILKGDAVDAIAAQSLLFEEFVSQENAQGNLKLDLHDRGPRTAFLHGHCHQKAFGAMPAVVSALQLVPNLSVKVIDSSCCGMAGAFGYEREHYEVSMKMAERSLLPAVRQAPANALIVADGTSCRHQIEAGAARAAIHVAHVLESAL